MRRAAAALVLLLASAAALASVPELAQARVAGEGSFRWFGLKLYDARLWLGAQGYAPGTAPLALELRYARSLSGKRIAAASHEEMKKLGAANAAQLYQWLAAMEGLFPDVEEGTRIAGVWLPGEGARFYRDGRLLGEIRDAAFAAAFFAIWLDPRTSAPQLRAELLRGAGAP